MLTRLLKNAGALNATLVVSILAKILATFFQLSILGMGYYAIATGFQTTPWLLLFLAALVGGFCRFGEQYLGHLVAFKLLSRFRNKVYDKLMVLAPAKLDNKHSSDLLKLVAQDISQIEIFYAHTLSPVVIAAVVSVIQVIVLAFVSPWLALIALIAYAVMGIWMPLHHAKRMKTPTAALSKADTLHQRLAAETVAGKFELQQYQASDPQLAKLNAATSDYWSVSRDKSSKQDRQALVMQLVLVISLAVFGIVAVSQNVSLMWVLLFPFSFSRVLALASLPGSLSGGLLAAKKFFALLDEEPTVVNPENGATLTELTNANLNQVAFAYPQRPDDQVLDSVSMTLTQGERIGIIGTSGEGKSTIVKLLMRWYDANAGQLAVNHTAVSAIDLDSLRGTMNYMSQTPQLFDGTIRENLTLRDETISDDTLWERLAWVQLTDVIKQLPDQLATPISTAHDSLSAGELQRLELARALAHPSSLLILDEPTSNLDVRNEALILAAVKQHYTGSVIIVTHRESTLAICDRVLRLSHGRLKPVSYGDKAVSG